MELRDVEVFLALADELHFGRTAERLHISQARVSQVIGKLERATGAALFDRTTRSVHLTPIGRRLRDDLSHARDLFQDALVKANCAARGVGAALRVGVLGAVGHEIRPLIKEFRSRHDGGEVQLMESRLSDPFGLLRTNEVDAQILWLPIQETDLIVGPVVMTEGRVLAVPADCELAGLDSVTWEQLADHPVADLGSPAPPYWVEALAPRRTPNGRLIKRGPSARTLQEVLALVADGKIISPLPEHSTRYFPYPGIAYVPLREAPSTQWALVWSSTTDRSGVVRAFAEVAEELANPPA
ncbi:LysR family transcriptional regulator [Streptomyces virginiae]|uniref:LysR family transcriptional regulator n=1 Tax=Streptomyces virginiae TaxID=1961 RepID=UPI002DB5E8D7|nr:LysR substrate-binding domain-containing protein [Streptomyces sp. CMAA1738]MEC4571985.1 LysR substrate-binding domain-containing protein [Streptomyces sp. CMAA1738]